MNCGSVDSFQSSTRCGLSPNARQIREIAVWFNPTAFAIDRVDQCAVTVGRRLFQRLDDHRLDLLIGDLPRRARPRLVRQALQPLDDEPRRHLPTVARVTPNAQPPDVFGAPIGTRQHDPRPQRPPGSTSRAWIRQSTIEVVTAKGTRGSPG